MTTGKPKRKFKFPTAFTVRFFLAGAVQVFFVLAIGNGGADSRSSPG